jgi:type I restriction enzyme, R subunit
MTFSSQVARCRGPGGSRTYTADSDLSQTILPIPGHRSWLDYPLRSAWCYSGQSIQSEVQVDNEATPQLFYFNQLLISTCFFQARFAPVGAAYEHFHEWKDPYPLNENQLAHKLHTKQPSSQQVLVQGMLLPANLLDLLYNFTLFRVSGGRKIKLVARYHQFRAVRKAIDRLHHPTRRQHGEEDQRSGIIWHTQGSGKSLTMVSA